jgi:nucleotide-binding universal stress UspA family protein
MKRILVAVDFSECSVVALDLAATIAGKFEARLLVLHVLHDPAESPGFYMAKKAGKKVFRNMKDAAQQMMADFVKKHLKKFKEFDDFIVSGLPAAQIISFAERKKVDVIVMGTHGRGGLNRLMLGSVADKVVRTATCPVLIVREPNPKKVDE